MNYHTFHTAFKRFPVFSVQDIRKRFTSFDFRRLVEWQKKGYLLKVRRGTYCFADQVINESMLNFTANKLYSPSYVSLETAFSYYNFIPEGVFKITSITTKNTSNFETPLGHFGYRHVKSSLYFGYRLIKFDDMTYKIAFPEKAILDFFYLKKLNTFSEIEETRFNKNQIIETIDFEQLDKFQRIFHSPVLDKRIALFKKIIYA